MNYLQWIKPNTFIAEYLKYCDNFETPQSFDFWGAIWILSIICNRKIIINRPNNKLFTNFYITFVADSGICRKSTAVKIAKNILQSICNENSYHLLDSYSSQAKLVYELTKSSKTENKCIMAVNASEFTNFFNNKTIIETFLDLYDCPDRRIGYGTFSNGNISLNNVFVSCLSASTPDNYLRSMDKENIENGFTSRNIIIRADKGKRKIPWGTEGTGTEKLTELGTEISKFVSKQHTENIFTDQAIRQYSSWYVRRRTSTDLYTRTFESREQDFVLKLATLLAINELSTQVTEDHIKIAIKIIQNVKKEAIKFFNNDLYKEEKDLLQITIEKIINIIHSKGQNGIKHRDLYLRVHNSCSIDDYNYIINILHELDLIEKLQPYKSKTVIYRETKNIFNYDIKSILSRF